LWKYSERGNAKIFSYDFNGLPKNRNCKRGEKGEPEYPVTPA